ncbi:protein-L-isoaspartate(D-aspartate) O-methyltransferase [Bartonella henselae]|uniref:protein-L-isoaspartate(D-aspartate) O-methyltransferase n=1 Tax=Bartonella henselae TaxID=38323 RepID=UPI0003DF8386|nr:protein-L-isoaspartate(D-aspartate) O-methyltransferase [Bartonella henselae]ETS07956.1 protein-L-isoaspartate O-methyltransferase [Bartonella henselae JK 42]ETS12374.1 protein-L-isoaspartate O-methyltransferase [Bartonella henselae JK 41]KEC56718.1 protein-L-isoaspartate O-methyltransferase [Bartonella henselae str. Zeus]KEC61499.1 protein-L-isoaspartate O-methyltransferase [Bartonella henselae JK 53]MDM9982718.1 protein-L-isoaspartate(D-aspartate) O-methyltransferase [Bartonella henselae]
MDQKGILRFHEELASLVLKMRSKGIDDVRFFTALEKIPRQQFVSFPWFKSAYDNKVIPIECGEYIERLEEQLLILYALSLKKKHRVLEIGTGSGFCTAFMACLSDRVITVDRYKTLVDLARQKFQTLGIENIVVRQIDGSRIITGFGSFDRILIWPSRSDEPKEFLELLTENGILIQAIGPDEGVQTITRYTKIASRFECLEMFQVRYQPFIEGIAETL